MRTGTPYLLALTQRISGRTGMLYKVSGKENATLPNGYKVYGKLDVIGTGLVTCEGEDHWAYTTEVQSWDEEDGVIVIKTLNSTWAIAIA